MLSRPSTRACGGLLLLSLLVLSVGCTNKYKARATVKGRVTFSKTPLTTGTVTFYGRDNLTGSASIDKDGNYVMKDAPLGEVTITVYVPPAPAGGVQRMKMVPPVKDAKGGGSVNPDDPSQRIGIMGEMPSRVVPISEKYAKPGTSGLTYTVEKGEHTKDIDLTP